MTALIEVHDARVHYLSTGSPRSPGRPALGPVSLTVRPGDLTLVSGPSGCGKSTLLRLLNGLIPHAYRAEVTGEVRVGGRPVADMTVRELSSVVGTMLQDPRRQVVGTTVAAEIAFGPENLGLPREEIRRRIAAIAGRVGVGHLLERATSELSGGELQMVAFAGVLAMDPEVVVVDEPLANLDPAAGLRLMREIRRFVDEGGAAVVVEHRVEEILEFGPGEVLYLEDGATRYLGPVEGFLRVAPAGHVKLPFPALVARAADLPSVTPPPRPGGGTPVPRLEYRGVTLAYGPRAVLTGVDLALGARQRVAVLGPNGAGKSTLLRAAVMLATASRGEVLVDGSPVAERSIISLATTFGYVFQNPGQALFSATVGRELAFGPRNLGRRPEEIAEDAAEVLRATLLDGEAGIMDRPPRTLSFGQQRRLTVALALAMRPRTLILDEPTAGQDLHTTTAFMGHALAAGGVESVYFITHDVDLALTYADRVVVVDDGRVVADGSPADLARAEDVWAGAGLRATGLVRALREHLPGLPASGAAPIPHPFDLARHISLSARPPGFTPLHQEGPTPS
ncbi:energy-coupling factor ABC transporter ATP-binding protein [Sphaerisporangium siamense]|uniref:Energy-coupling factor transport system ATP-binding protein n=1 Tax=Sphaerisporangium siamense TaxID=795645 RepID=A0A7W7D993_9ACTN|nr:ABC transporter ATP-binding protein [Sphaerisporangium siamense]MBB4702629.1 energy-coupling factor transport system ATP-binding protein [Sphaerisporangium siamense]GII83618.1 energy-coupling factor ABC transporter ATP-binding protein [Sphaerisporangium siamense]